MKIVILLTITTLLLGFLTIGFNYFLTKTYQQNNLYID